MFAAEKSPVDEIKKDCKLIAVNPKKKNFDKEYVIYNGVDNWAMSYAIQKNLMHDLEEIILPGMKYTGDNNNLLPWIQNGKII